ncbi:transcription factor iiia [Crucibulum laeve]|uniref:Transcription factor iiia n=1 Tax=Crucibulum laeve TaxID=68775 RepID=A0A5C3MJ79_9AGAR|nr:transcription factor iiia [Crucibulum laeve]
MVFSAGLQTVTTLQSATALGKRKAISEDTPLVLRLTSSPELSSYAPTDSECDAGPSSSKIQLKMPILVNGVLMPHTKKRYLCTHAGCDKAYTKPSRLAEHKRSHTGQRPFVCESCSKSYLRETHLHAHARTHLPESARPFVCDKLDCTKRFWTSQHLRNHMDWHNGAKPFTCVEEGCNEAFAKHHQLRAHICSTHAPPGTKPYPCKHEGCTKSFATNQHLRAHVKIHDDKRYTCIHHTCLAQSGGGPTYFATWTALQHHMRTAHLPTCPHPSCNERTFSTQKGLRAHQKLHEEQELEQDIYAVAKGSDNEAEDEPLRKKRRGGEIGRDWKCAVDGCGKDFKSKKALTTHNNVTHLGRRDFVCTHDKCGRSYGYKHLLQRHIARAHAPPTSSSSHSEDSEDSDSPDDTFNIDLITGYSYAKHARAAVASGKMLRCPYPHLPDDLLTVSAVSPQVLEKTVGTSANCGYVFSRAYDLRRHLRATHAIETQKDDVDEWVKDQKGRS